MTCIVGLVHEGGVYIGGDAAGVDGADLRVRSDKKVYLNGEYAIGFAGSFRQGQLIHYKLAAPPVQADVELSQFMVTTFVDAVRSCLIEGGVADLQGGEMNRGTLIVGVRGRLFTIECDYNVGEEPGGFTAIGCGAPVALGVLFALRHSADVDPVTKVRTALEAAERFSAGVRGPFIVTKTAARRE